GGRRRRTPRDHVDGHRACCSATRTCARDRVHLRRLGAPARLHDGAAAGRTRQRGGACALCGLRLRAALRVRLRGRWPRVSQVAWLETLSPWPVDGFGTERMVELLHRL